MQKTIFFTMGALIMATGVHAATITVAQDGSGDATSVSAALAAAANGDEIVIADSAVYAEDITAGAGFQAGLPASFTLKAAAGQTPTIKSVNTAERSGFLGIPGPDYFGAFFFGCQGVLIEGITFETSDELSNAGSIASILSVFDSVGFTIRNCTVRGVGGDIDYPDDNLGIAIISLGAAAVTSGVLIEDCLIEETNIGIAIAKFPDMTVPADPSVTVRGCTIQHCDGSGIEVDNGAYPELPEGANPDQIALGDGNLFENNTMIDTGDGVALGGGYSVVRNCTVIDSRGDGITFDRDGARGTSPIMGIVENCTVTGSANDGVRLDDAGEEGDTIFATVTDCAFVANEESGARIDGGNATIEDCIFAGNGSYGIWLADDSRATVANVDHCDIYQNHQTSAVEPFEVYVQLDSSTLLQLNISNSIVVGELGLLNGEYEGEFDEESLFASYCNVFTADDPFIQVVVDNESSVDPMYENASIDPTTFTAAGFSLAPDSPALTLDANGSYLGSQGLGEVDVDSWNLY